MGTTFGTPTYGANGVVATPHYLASLAGADVLRDGGSAVDAAIAANLVLAVVWPNMCGPGGDLFAQVWDGALFGLNASGRAGAGMTFEAYRERGLDAMPVRGPLSVTVPGAVSGWFALHERWGRLDMARLARDAMRHARDGYRVTAFVGDAVRSNLALLAEHGTAADVFAPGGQVPRAGDRVAQPELADSLELIVTQGPSVLYGGSLGRRIADFVAARGGLLTGGDLLAHRVEWVEPLRVAYRGVEVAQLPPNSQGIALLQILNMLSASDVCAWSATERVHELVERKKRAFADRDAFVADPACVDVPIERMLHAGSVSAAAPAAASTHAADGDTIYLCAADRDGMVVSLIQSLYAAWGSGVHVPGTGITLHNRGWGFTLEDGHPNGLAPGKRPRHTLMPGFALKDGQPWLAFGTRGADGQPQTGLQILTGLLDLGLDLQAAIEAPRWVQAPPGDRFARDALVLESRFGPSVAQDLASRGHDVVVADPLDMIMGTVQLIQVDTERGCYIAATDPRGDGVALAV
ncbi:MAG TPA: gamma-glutamyltransferase family protein [Chloroflexota bacterium]|jgi:gamma-glutamyltranspeptidase/glutathione hydrolase